MIALNATVMNTGRTRSQARLSWIFCMTRSSGQRPVVGIDPGPFRRETQMRRAGGDLFVFRNFGHDHLVAEAGGNDLVVAEILDPLDRARHAVRRAGLRQLDEFRADAESEL